MTSNIKIYIMVSNIYVCIGDHIVTNSGSRFMEENSHRDLRVCAFAGAHLCMCVRLQWKSSVGLYEFLVPGCVCSAQSCMCVHVYKPADGAYMFTLRFVYLCVLCVHTSTCT